MAYAETDPLRRRKTNQNHWVKREVRFQDRSVTQILNREGMLDSRHGDSGKNKMPEYTTVQSSKFSYESCCDFLRNSACFIFHKRSKFRKMMIKLVIGNINQPCFKTVDELIDFYTQIIDDETDTVLRLKNENEEEADDSDGSGIDLEFMNETDDNLKFLQDVNSSAYIDEIRRVQDSKYFSICKLQEQGKNFKVFQESGKFEEIFNGQYLKNGGLYYLTNK